MIVLRKQVAVTQGQLKLFDDSPFFFFITNLPKSVSPKAVVGQANKRCDQENIISQGKAMGALSAPLHDLVSNWAYMVIATLAWNLKSWLALSITESCPPVAKQIRRADKQRVIRMDFATFRQTLIQIPTQIVTGGRRLFYRLLTWTPSLETFFRIAACVSQPLRH